MRATDQQAITNGAGLPVRLATTVDAVIVSWKGYVSHCKLCRRVVLTSHRWVWSTNPLGIVHEECP
jgi:hypothetical protein